MACTSGTSRELRDPTATAHAGRGGLHAGRAHDGRDGRGDRGRGADHRPHRLAPAHQRRRARRRGGAGPIHELGSPRSPLPRRGRGIGLDLQVERHDRGACSDRHGGRPGRRGERLGRRAADRDHPPVRDLLRRPERREQRFEPAPGREARNRRGHGQRRRAAAQAGPADVGGLPVRPRPSLRSDERGVAMVAVMGVLLVTAILGFAVAAAADRTNAGAIRDANGKRALAAADAGLNAGRFRIGKTYGSANATINDGKCFPDTGSATCAWSAPESVGNGATFRYWVSPVGAVSSCVGAATPVSPATLRQRCVIAEGEANGARRLLQARIVENRGAPIFPFPGMIGLDRISLNQSDAVGSVGTNGQLLIGPNSDIRDPGTIRLGGSGWSVNPSNYGTPNRAVSPDPFVLDYYTEWYSESVRAPATGTNQIGTISSAPGVSITGARQVAIAPSSTVTLTGGRDYNFCSLVMNSDGQFVVPAGTTEPVRVFIDSSNRPGNPNYVPSGCPNLTGNVVDLRSGAGFVNNTGKPSMLQLFVYGGPNQNIVFDASAEFTGTIWAPQSKIVFNAGATVTGAIAARDIEFNQNGGDAGFTGDPEANNATGRWDGSYTRNGWRECPPSAGC